MPIKVKRNGAWVEVYGGAGGANNEEGIGTKNFVIPIEHSLDNDSNDVYTLGETYSYSDLIAAIDDGNEISCRIASKQSRAVILLPLIEYSMRDGHFKFSGLYNEQLVTVTITNINDNVLVEYINPNVNADWSQADENASDYIKNKTHYSINIISNVKVTTQTSTPFDNSSHSLYNQGYRYRSVLLSGNSDLVYRQLCAVSLICPELNIFDNILAFVDGFYKGEVGHGPYFSYKVAIEQNPSSGLDLVMYSNYSVDPAEFFISVSSIYQISEKYIPDTIARVEDLSQVQGGIVVTDKNSDGNIVISNLLPTSTYAENLSF